MWMLQALQIEFASLDYEIIVVMNMCKKEEYNHLTRYWLYQSGILKVLQYDEKPSNWQARNLGAFNSSGQYIMHTDSHVFPEHNAWVSGLKYHYGWKGCLHFGTNYWIDHPNRFNWQYRWQPEKFWGAWSRKIPSPPNYKILMSGTAGLLIDRETWNEIGGFHNNLGIYGGGEPWINLKTQILGYDVRCNPAFKQYHLTEKRGYSGSNMDRWHNFMLVAYALGGDKYLTPVYENFKRVCHKSYYPQFEEEYRKAVKEGQEERQWCKDNCKYSLDEVLMNGHI